MRTHLIAMLVLGVLLVLCGAAGFVLHLSIYEDLLAIRDRWWADDFEPATSRRSYAALYQSAKSTKAELVRVKIDRGASVGATSMALGGLLVWWALDRRRLIRKLTQATGV